MGTTAKQLFERMDFSIFYDEKSGLIGGNIKYEDKKWTREEYNFSNLGSEARLIYSEGWALGLFKNFANDANFLSKALDSLNVEVHHSEVGDLLKLWDGSAFQLYFPKLFVNEEVYSDKMR